MDAVNQNRATVEAGLSKRKAAKQAQEQAHEDMRRAMFDEISSNHIAACNKREQEEAELKAHKAQRAARAEMRTELSILVSERNKGLQRVFKALAAGAITSIFLVLDGVKMWVAIPVFAVCLGVMLRELVREAKRIPAIKALRMKEVR